MKKFWNWARDEDGARTLRLEGPIDSDDFWSDAVTPKAFREELEADTDDVIVWINSEGGSVFAAAEIYTMLKDYKGGVTVKIASVAASAASVVAMAGDEVLMSPTAMLFLHDPSTIAVGNTRDMEKAIDTLNAVKDSIINAYRAKTGLSRARLSKIMEDESWIHAEDAVKMGFADGILFDGKQKKASDEAAEASGETAESDADADDSEEDSVRDAADSAVIYSTKAMGRLILNRLTSVSDCIPSDEHDAGEAEDADAAPAEADTAESPADVEAVEDGTAEETADGAEASAEPDGPPSTDDAGPPDAPDDAGEPPSIGMDGKTKDGAMPYDLLKRQLDFLK